MTLGYTLFSLQALKEPGGSGMARGTVVLVEGKLCGAGQEAQCKLLARKIDIEVGKCPYTDCAVIASPGSLPDGEYTLLFEYYCATAKRQRGTWVSVGIPQTI